MTFSISALVSARDSHIKPDSEAGGLIWVEKIRCKKDLLTANIRIGPHTSASAPEFNFQYLRSGLKENISKYKERWCIKSYFNQITTIQNIGIKFK
jgi:hypothetical protein